MTNESHRDLFNININKELPITLKKHMQEKEIISEKKYILSYIASTADDMELHKIKKGNNNNNNNNNNDNSSNKDLIDNLHNNPISNDNNCISISNTNNNSNSLFLPLIITAAIIKHFKC